MNDDWYTRKQTFALSEIVMASTLRVGSRGSDVIRLQEELNAAGFSLSVDGVFGKGTESDVISFQLSSDLTADGVVGPATWAALDLVSEKTGPIEWSSIVSLLPQMVPQQYQLSKAQCPSQPLGMTVKRIGQQTTNCVLFTAWVLSHAMGKSFSSTQWSDWMVSSGSPDTRVPGYGPRVVMSWGMGTTSPGDGPWLVQYFTDTGGHSMIVVAHDKKTDKILTLESNSGFNLNGCGWGDIGNLRDIFNPGPDWVQKVTQTWASRLDSKHAVHVVQLNISSESVRSWLQEGVS